MDRTVASQSNLQEADEAFLKGEWEKAATLYGHAVESNDCSSDTIMAFSRTLRNLHRTEEANNAAERALATSWSECGELAREIAADIADNPTADEELQSVWQKRDEERFTAAQALVESLTQAQPQDASLWELNGNLQAKLHLYDEALQSYEEALSIDTNRVPSLNACGRILMRLGKPDEALIFFEKVVTFEPTKAGYWRSRARVLDKLGKLDEAIQSYDKALELEPERAFYWAGRGKLLDEVGRFPEALQSYDKALQLDPDRFTYWRRRGRILQKLRNFEEANKSIAQAEILRRKRFDAISDSAI